jgi:hypothetical protein
MFDITSKTVVPAPLALKLHLFPGKEIGLPVSGGGSLEIIYKCCNIKITKRTGIALELRGYGSGAHIVWRPL